MKKELNESLLRDKSKQQMTQLNRTIKSAGGDIQDIVKKGEKTKESELPNTYYMDNPFDSKRTSIETQEHFVKNDAHYKSTAMKSRDPKRFKKIKKSKMKTFDTFSVSENMNDSLRTMNAHYQTYVLPNLTDEEQEIIKKLDIILFKYNYDNETSIRLSFKSPLDRNDSFQLILVNVTPEIYKDMVKIVEKNKLIPNYDGKNKLFLNIYYKNEKRNKMNKNNRSVNEELKFSDGMEFDLSGPLRKEEKSDGWYVVGNGMLIPVRDEDEADEYIKEDSPRAHPLDDLKANFRSWEQGCDTPNEAEELFNILSDLHPNFDKKELKQIAYDWVGCETEDEVNESITAKKWNNTVDILVNKYKMDSEEAYFALQNFMGVDHVIGDRSEYLSPSQLAKYVKQEYDEDMIDSNEGMNESKKEPKTKKDKWYCPDCKVELEHNQSSNTAWLECPKCSDTFRTADLEKHALKNITESKKEPKTKKENFIPTKKLNNLKSFYEVCDKEGDCTKKSDVNDDSWVKGTKEDMLRPMFKNLPDTTIRPSYDVLRTGKMITLFGKECRVIGLKNGQLQVSIMNDKTNEFEIIKYDMEEVEKELKKNYKPEKDQKKKKKD
jgi:hypothetical protein